MADKRVWLVPGVLAIALVGLLVASSMLWSRNREQVDPGVLVAARQEAVNFFSLDYRHTDEDIDRILDSATGKFKTQYAAKRHEIASGVREKKLIARGSVPVDGAAVEYQRGDRAQVVVAVDVATTTSKGDSEPSRFRARLVLRNVSGSWLVSDLKQVG